MSIALYEDFADPLGKFSDYDTYDPAQRTQLALQKHVDIRSFEQDSITAPYTMFDLDGRTIATLDGLTMSSLDGGNVLRQGENWTDNAGILPSLTLYPSTSLYPEASAVGPQSDRHYLNGIYLNCTTGTNTTASVVDSIDISKFLPSDYVSLALPALPLASLTLASTFLDLSSDPTGGFDPARTDSLPFSTSLTTLSAGDSEARWAISTLTHADLSKITAVRLRVEVSGACAFRCLAIRAIASTWEYAPTDQNTLYERMAATVPPTGSISASYSFPAAAGPVTPTDWPILLFSDGASGPTLVDAKLGAIIHTGSNAATNTFTLYLRELPIITRDMTDCDLLTMGDLDALGRMPDYTPGTLDNFAQSHFVAVTMNWGTSGAIHIKDQSGTGYDFTGLTFAPATDYYLSVALEFNTLRVQVLPVSFAGVVDWSTVVFDSTTIVDDNFIRRYRGRVGWYAHFGDGDANVRMLRPRKLVYSAYWSAPLRSRTPVEGARLYPDSSPDIELYDRSLIARSGTTLAPDLIKSSSGRSVRMQCDGTLPLEGFVTDTIRFENLYDSIIEFDVLAPASAQLLALLQGEARLLSLYLPAFTGNRWTHMTIPLALTARTVLPGSYRLYLVQNQTAPSTFYIDNLSIRTRAVQWDGRGQAADPWGMNDPAFIDFGKTINDPFNGALLGRGSGLQVRGQMLTQTAAISGLKLLPHYATLGNFVWTESQPAYGSAPVPSFTTLVADDTVTVDASASTAANGIAAYYWTFGDGVYGYGENIAHTYATDGTYTVNLTLIDTLDRRVSITHSVSI